MWNSVNVLKVTQEYPVSPVSLGITVWMEYYLGVFVNPANAMGMQLNVIFKVFALLVNITRQDLFVNSACLASMEIHPKELLRTASPVPVL